MKRIRNIHPGEVLQEEFLTPLNITAYRLAKDIQIPQTRVAMILKGERRITADTALRLSVYFAVSPKFWLGLQDDYDVEEEKITQKKVFENIRAYTELVVGRPIDIARSTKQAHVEVGKTKKGNAVRVR